MRLTILGSGGALRTPRACCDCTICKQARSTRGKHQRLGQALFIHDANLLFDTPEDINTELNDNAIRHVDHIILTHWHPDHTSGYRIVQQLREGTSTPLTVHLPRDAEKTFREKVPGLFFHAQQGLVTIDIFDTTLQLSDLTITATRINDVPMHSYTIDQDSKRVVYCPCHSKHLTATGKSPDLLLINSGIIDENDLNETQRKNTLFSDNLTLIKNWQPTLTVLTHLEETWRRTPADYARLGKKHHLTFAHDGMTITI